MPWDGNIDETINLQIEYKKFEVDLSETDYSVENAAQKMLDMIRKFFNENYFTDQHFYIVYQLNYVSSIKFVSHLYYQEVKE